MKTSTAIVCGLVLLSTGQEFAQGSSASAQQEIAMAAPIVFFDIAGPDGASQRSFYATVFGWNVDRAVVRAEHPAACRSG